MSLDSGFEFFRVELSAFIMHICFKHAFFTCTLLKSTVSLISMRHGFHKTGTCMRVPLELFTAEGEALRIFTDYRSLITARNGTRRDQENLKLRPTRAGNEGGGLTVSNAVERYVTVSNA